MIDELEKLEVENTTLSSLLTTSLTTLSHLSSKELSKRTAATTKEVISHLLSNKPYLCSFVE